MKIYTEQSLRYFEFWSGAKDNAAKLTCEELDRVETELIYQLDEEDGYDAGTINDMFWFDFDQVCAMIGYEYDSEHDEILRGDDITFHFKINSILWNINEEDEDADTIGALPKEIADFTVEGEDSTAGREEAEEEIVSQLQDTYGFDIAEIDYELIRKE